MGGVTALVAIAAAGIGVAGAAAPKPAKTVKGSLVSAVPGTLKPGATVPNSALGSPRVFVNANNGFALAAGKQAQYAAATTNGGKTWTIVSPALHVDALQAPLSVTQIGATSTNVAYAYGSGQVADVTSDGGKRWYRALFDGTVMAVVPGFGTHRLTAFVDGGASASGPSGPTWQYASTNGGKTWKLSPGS
jgi:hypothetical protein